MELSEDDFNKRISTVASPLHGFDFKPTDTLCLRTLVSVLALLPTGSHWPLEIFNLSVGLVFVGQGGIPSMLSVISPLLAIMEEHVQFLNDKDIQASERQ